MLTVYSDYGCPYLHRITAVATHLGLEFEPRYVEHGDPPAELVALSPSGRIPLVRVDDLTLYESTVICDYLAEAHGWQDAYPNVVAGRALHRLAIKQLGDVLMPSFASEASGAAPALRVHEALDQLEAAVTAYPAADTCMLALSAAPMWLLWKWAAHLSTLPERIEERPPLAQWFRRAGELPSIRATMPDVDRIVPPFEVDAVREAVRPVT